ncbi:MAG: hemolysin family protein [Bacillota bacterium]|nr:hemolysin family protein [Bacillota bacterium]
MDGVDWLRQFNVIPQLQFTALAAAAETAPTSSIWLDILVVLVLLLFNGFFSASEMAVVTLNDNRIRRQAEEGDKLARRILPFIDFPGRFLSTIQVGVTFAGFLSSAFAGERFASRLYKIMDPGGQRPWIHTLALILVTLLISYLSLVIGELVPKQIGIAYPEGFTRRFIGPITAFGRIVRPFTLLLNFSSNTILRIFGIKPDSNDRSVTEEEIRMMVDVSTDSGHILGSEKQMIQNVFEFNDKEVSEIMTHRVNLSALEIHASLEDAVTLAIEEGYTRLPVYEESIDNIVGILNVKDLLAFLARQKPEEWDLVSLIREPSFAPETKQVDRLFREMQTSNTSLTVIIDEYGGVAGIVTMEDLLEEIVGNIRDEYDEEPNEVTRNSDGTYTIDGLTELSSLERQIPDIHVDDDDIDYDTVAGLVLHQLDRIPDEDERPVVTYKNYRFEVLEVCDRRIASVRMTILDPPEPVEDDDSD